MAGDARGGARPPGRAAEWEADEGERVREQVLDMLQAIAQRFAATAHLRPPDVSDMSIAEKLACRLLPETLQPAGLPTEDQIWAEYRARAEG